MPKQLRFAGRYNFKGEPEGFSKQMGALVAQSMAGYEVEIVFIKKVAKPSVQQRKWFFSKVLPFFMEVMIAEEGWDLFPGNKGDEKEARIRIFNTFLRGYTITRSVDGSKTKIDLPSYNDMDEDDYDFLLGRLERHCIENYRKTIPLPDKNWKNKEPGQDSHDTFNADY